jgi:phage terminase large subunit-like protein
MPNARSSTAEPLYRSPDPTSVKGAWFDQEAVDKVLAFGRFCRHTKGRWAGRPIEFEPWQVEHFIAPIFGWKHPNGTRIRRFGYLEVPKKNGKSTKASALGLYLAGPDGEPGAEVYAAAAAKDQARIVFEPARSMVDRSPVLSKHFKKFRNTITYPKSDGVFSVVSADANVQDGLNVHGAIVDELHRHKSRDLIDILQYGTAARTQPLVLAITTAGEEGDTSIYAEYHDYCIKVAEGLVNDPTFFGCIYAAEAGDDWLDEKTWAKANPNLDVTISREYLRAEAAKAEAVPSKRNAFLRLHLNVRSTAVTRAIGMDRWDACGGKVDDPALDALECFGGLDLALSQDIASLVLDFPAESGHAVLYRFWLPADLLASADEQTSGMASRWVAAGHLTLTEGDVVDYETIEKQILADAERYDLREIAFNRRGARQLAQNLDSEGLVMVEMAPGITLAPATQEWTRLILGEEYRHGGNPVARYMFDVLRLKTDADGNTWPDKGKSKGNITGCVASVMALDRAMRSEGASVYEERGLLTL